MRRIVVTVLAVVALVAAVQLLLVHVGGGSTGSRTNPVQGPALQHP